MEGRVSAYSLRHQADVGLVDPAKAFDHLSVKSQGPYGSRQQVQKGGVAFAAIKAVCVAYE
jgi:hypothetical protein